MDGLVNQLHRLDIQGYYTRTGEFAKSRLAKEVKEMIKKPLTGIVLDESEADKYESRLIVNLNGPLGTVYNGESYKVQLSYMKTYPFTAPIAKFIGFIPIHPNIYSNGDFALPLLMAKEWSPAYATIDICHSIIAMLRCCDEKRRPMDDEAYMKRQNVNPFFLETPMDC